MLEVSQVLAIQKRLWFLIIYAVQTNFAKPQDIDIFRPEREYFSDGITEVWPPLFAILASFDLRKQFLDGFRLEEAFFQRYVCQILRNALDNSQRGLKFRSCLFALALLA